MKRMHREIFAGSAAVAVLLLTSGCGLAEKPPGKGSAVQPVGDSQKIGSPYGADGGDGAYGSGSGANPAYGDSGSGAAPAGAAARTVRPGS